MTASSLHIVHTESSLGWGGQEIRVLTEADGMIARGHRVTLLCAPESRIFREAVNRRVPAVALPIGRRRLRGLRALVGWLRAHPADVINTHSSTDTWLAALARPFVYGAPPIVRTRHISAPVPNDPATRWLYQRATAHIVTTGERLREQLIAHNRFDPKRLTSVPTGIDTKKFVPGDRAQARARLQLDEAPTVGIVATLRSWKGHEYLLRAFAALPDQASRLLIVGDGPQREALAARVRELGLADRVRMPGNQDDVLPWLQAMDVFVLPSYANEGVPQAIMQAMACALPVISTPIGSIAEIVEPEITGLLVPPKDADALQVAIARLLGDGPLRRTLADNARRTADAKCGLDPMLDRMEAVFRDVVRRRA